MDIQNITMFNWRVETFNNLLYLDIMTHEHAYILDSNKYLDYNYNMFVAISKLKITYTSLLMAR